MAKKSPLALASSTRARGTSIGSSQYGGNTIQARFDFLFKFDEGTHTELLQQQRDLTLGYAEARAPHAHCMCMRMRMCIIHCMRTCTAYSLKRMRTACARALHTRTDTCRRRRPTRRGGGRSSR